MRDAIGEEQTEGCKGRTENEKVRARVGGGKRAERTRENDRVRVNTKELKRIKTGIGDKTHSREGGESQIETHDERGGGRVRRPEAR